MRTPILTIITAAIFSAAGAPAFAAPSDYRFEIAGAPQKGTDGSSIVSVKLVHVPDGKAVAGAVFVEERADMGPEGMAAMDAPITPLPGQAGIYRFEVKNGPVWNKPGNWALTLSAKVPGEAKPVEGSVNVNLAP